ncbi:hypothetical protein ACS0PU_007135 [Formica fusca]
MIWFILESKNKYRNYLYIIYTHIVHDMIFRVFRVSIIKCKCRIQILDETIEGTRRVGRERAEAARQQENQFCAMQVE